MKNTDEVIMAVTLFINRVWRRTLVVVFTVSSLLTQPCRMRKEQPAEADAVCYLCAQRGGWLRCERSRQLKETATAQAGQTD